MGPVKTLNPKGKWKEVAIDPNLYGTAELENFLSFEELTDYELVEGELGKNEKNKGRKTEDSGNDNKSGDSTKKKKKKKKKKKRVVNSTESSDADQLESQEQSEGDDQLDTNQAGKKQKCKKEKSDSNQSSDENKTAKKPKKDVKLKGKRGKMVDMGNVEDVYANEDIDNAEPFSDANLETSDPQHAKPSSAQKRKASVGDSETQKKKKKKDISMDTGSAKTSPKSRLPDMASWKDLFVPEPVLKALAEQGFTAPMPIQTLTLPSACRDRKDIVGAAETGSGKTLAFGIPLLYHILRDKERLEEKNKVDEESGEEDEESGEEDEESGEEDEEEEEEQENENEEEEEEEEEDENEETGEEDEDQLSELEEDLPELEDDEMGCVQAVDNVSFDWLESESTTAAGKAPEAQKPVKPLYALVLAPTRELAIQVRNHINNAAKHTGIKAEVVVGGMAPQKQRRLMKRCPEIVVATPGRLWELIREDDPHLSKVSDVKFLVIDEADRMIEKGHFAELQGLLELVNRDEEKKKKRQTFVFSATLTMVHAGPHRVMKKKKRKKITSESKLDNLMESIGIKPKPKIVDLTNKIGMAEKVVESRIHCSMEEKDLYLYYLLQQYPGRTLVFSNSKDCVRRLVSVFTLLQCNPLPLHADMHQRQRLKNLDKFRDNPRSLLLATDVAARGLDIPGVQHVVHYQVPRTSENYVHRSGRTARGYSEGLSVVLIGPKELKSYRKILHTLKREDDLPMFPVEDDYLPQLKERVALAKSIDKSEHQQNKKKVENNWFEKTAKEMDMELDEDFLLYDLGDSHSQATKKKALLDMRADLKRMLSHAVIPRFFSGKYPTMTGKLRVPYMRERNIDGAVSKVKDVRKTQPKNVVNVMRQKKKKQKQRKK